MSGLRVISNHGGKTFTNTEVVDAVKITQQLTKRKSHKQHVFQFQDLSNLLLLLLLLYGNAVHSNVAGDDTVSSF